MPEWLEWLQQEGRGGRPGVAPAARVRVETEAGIPLPPELARLYAALDGGEFPGELRLYPLVAEGEAPSVQRKSRLALVGLPAAGLWRFGCRGAHLHLFAARPRAMQHQGDGGGPLPAWLSDLAPDDYVYGAWDAAAERLELHRTLAALLDAVRTPPTPEAPALALRAAASLGAPGGEAGAPGGEEPATTPSAPEAPAAAHLQLVQGGAPADAPPAPAPRPELQALDGGAKDPKAPRRPRKGAPRRPAAAAVPEPREKRPRRAALAVKEAVKEAGAEVRRLPAARTQEKKAKVLTLPTASGAARRGAASAAALRTPGKRTSGAAVAPQRPLGTGVKPRLGATTATAVKRTLGAATAATKRPLGAVVKRTLGATTKRPLGAAVKAAKGAVARGAKAAGRKAGAAVRKARKARKGRGPPPPPRR